MPIALRDYWPLPTAVPLGGSPRAVLPLRLRDLAHLERWAADRSGGARATLADALSVPDPTARREALYAAYDLAKSGGPHLEEDAVAVLVESPEGVATQLWLTLRQADPEIRPEDALDLAATLEPGEYPAFLAVAWHLDALDDVAGAIDREIGVSFPVVRRPAKPGAWAAAVASFLRAYPGWTLEALGNLTLPQWDALAGGERPHLVASPTRPPGWSAERWQAEVSEPRRRFWLPYWERKRKSVRKPQPQPPTSNDEPRPEP